MTPEDGSSGFAPDDGNAPDDWANQPPDEPAAGDNPAGDNPAGDNPPGDNPPGDSPTGQGGSSRGGGGRRGGDQATGDGGAGRDAGDPESPAEISRRLAEEASVADGAPAGGRTRHGVNGEGMSAVDVTPAHAGAAADGSGDPSAIPEAVTELLPSFNEAASPETAPPDEAELNAVAPPLNQAGHTGSERNNKPALWVTAIAFGAVLLVSAGWLWTRRGPYDPA